MSQTKELSLCCCSVTKSCTTLCNPMDCSMPGCSVLHYLLEFAQTHVHWVSDAIQPSHPLSPFSPPALNFPQHQDLFQWVGCLHQVAKILEFQLQHQSFQWIFRVDFLRIDWFDLLAVQRKFKSLIQHYSSKASVLGGSAFSMSNSHIHTWLLEKPQLWLYGPLWANWCLFLNMLSRFVIAFLPRSNRGNWKKKRWQC